VVGGVKTKMEKNFISSSYTQTHFYSLPGQSVRFYAVLLLAAHNICHCSLYESPEQASWLMVEAQFYSYKYEM
jgi:hypothetical protein